MESLLLTIHIIACISLIILVLLQSGHEGMGVIFGGSSSSFFGSSGAGGLLSKLTITMAVIFFMTSLSFTFLDSHKNANHSGSVMMEQHLPAQSTAVPASGTQTAPSTTEPVKAEPATAVPATAVPAQTASGNDGKNSGQESKNPVPTPSTQK